MQKPKPWGGRRKRRRGRWANREKEIHEDFEQEDEMPFMSLDLAKHVSELEETLDGRPPLSEIDIMIQKGLEKGEKSDEFKTEPPSSNTSDDSGSSFNDNRKAKDRGSPNSLNNKQHSLKFGQSTTVTRASKRERDWDTSIESDGSDGESEYVRMQKKQRRPKTRKLDSNPLFWSVDDVFRYLRKTNDCKDIAYRVKQEVMYTKILQVLYEYKYILFIYFSFLFLQEIDGLAFLLLNLPSLTQHMKLRTSLAMKLCRHVEQVKVTFFLRHINEVEPEQYQIV